MHKRLLSKVSLLCIFLIWSTENTASADELVLEINEYRAKVDFVSDYQPNKIVKSRHYVAIKNPISGKISYIFNSKDIKRSKNPIDLVVTAFLAHHYGDATLFLIDHCACHAAGNLDWVSTLVERQSSIRFTLSKDEEERVLYCAQKLDVLRMQPYLSFYHEIPLPAMSKTCQKPSRYTEFNKRPSLYSGHLTKSTTTGEKPAKDWTIFIYAAADEGSIEEAEIRKSTVDIFKGLERIQGLNETSKVQFVVQHDDVGNDPNYRYLLRYSPTHNMQKMGPDTPYIPEAEIQRLDKSFHYGERDSGDPRTLKSFLSWGVRAYPAKHYMLILSGHSWGIHGHMQDFFYGGKQHADWSTLIKNYELRRVMEELYREEAQAIPERKFDLLFMDACVAGQLEVALEIKDMFDYFVASATETPHNAFSYKEIFESFIAVINSSQITDNNMAHQNLERIFLKPLIEWYVNKHSPGGSMASIEKEVSSTSLFALRTSKLDEVAFSLRSLVSALKETDVVKEFQNGKIKTVNMIADSDGNADLLQFASSIYSYLMQRYLLTKNDKYFMAGLRALALRRSLNDNEAAGGPDEPMRISLDNAQGAWIHISIDSTTRYAEVAVCKALSSFINSNQYNSMIIPELRDEKNRTVNASDIDCDDLAEAEEAEDLEQDLKRNDGPIAIKEIFGIKLLWKHGVAAYLSIRSLDEFDSSNRNAQEIRNGVTRGRRRVISIWVDRGNQKKLSESLVVDLPGMTAIQVEYLSAKPVEYLFQKSKFKKFLIDSWGVCMSLHSNSQNTKDGLYVSEAHGRGSLFKHGLGIFLRHNPDLNPNGGKQRYMVGRKPIEQEEKKPNQMTLETYLGSLEEHKKLQIFPFKGRDFYRLHRISDTGWSDFVFGQFKPSSTLPPNQNSPTKNIAKVNR